MSSVCGKADGISKCGSRQFSFKDKLTGIEILSWPYKGYSFDSLTYKLTLDPAQADATIVVTVTINLLNYPTVFMSQDIAAVVDRVKTPPFSRMIKRPQSHVFNSRSLMR